MRHCCRNCHFLVKGPASFLGDKDKEPWNKEEREKGKINRALLEDSFCYREFWNRVTISSLGKTLDKNRKDDCFFVEYHEGMSFEAATELQRERREIRHRKRNLTFGAAGTVIGVAVSAIGIIISEDFREFLNNIAEWILK